MNYLSKIDNWKTSEKNNPPSAINILYIKEKVKYWGYILKINSNYEKQIIILMIPNEEKEKWHYHTVKKIGEHISCGYSMLTIWVFHNTENKHTLYHGEDSFVLL